MKKYRVLATALAAAAFLAGCGGSDPGNQTPRVTYTRMVNFGDSLSDVGTYATFIVGTLNGEGKYSINGDFSKQVSASAPDGLLYTNWTEYLAATLRVEQPCAAETGLDSPTVAPTLDLSFLAEPATFHDTVAPAGHTMPCSSYAQGGARVTDPHGPANRFFWDAFQSTSGLLGQLTIPVTTQVDNFIAHTSGFTSTDIVTVLAGGNDVFINRGVYVDGTVAAAEAAVMAGSLTQDQANATLIKPAADAAVAAMTQAGKDLAAIILTKIVANHATHVVVVNLPDVSVTPDAAIWNSAGGGVYANAAFGSNLTLAMTQAFNTALAADLGVTAGESLHPEILWVDAFTASEEQVTNPSIFGLTNVTTPACQVDVTLPGSTGLTLPGSPPTRVPLGSSLFCTKDSLTTDLASAMTYEFADTVHPTPYGYRLLASLVGERMAGKGWL